MSPWRSASVQPKPPVLVLTARRAPVASTTEFVVVPVLGLIRTMALLSPAYVYVSVIPPAVRVR